MKRFALAAFLLAAPFAMARDTGIVPCVPLNAKQLQIQTKSEVAVHLVRAFTPINIFAARHEAKGLKNNVTMITKVSKKKVKRGPCGSQRQVWRTLKNGHKKYRCK